MAEPDRRFLRPGRQKAIDTTMNPWLRRAVRHLAPTWVRNALERSIVELERFHPPRVVERPPGQRILVLAPHPDDESIGCGGTIARWVGAGAAVRVVVLTDGRQGDPEMKRRPSGDPVRREAETALARTRREEVLAALAVLGVAEHDLLALPDGALTDSVAAAAPRIADILAGWRPDLVALPFLTDRHADHFATNRCLMAALDEAQAAGHAGFDCLGYEIWSPIYANLYVDVSDAMERKRAAIRCHASQLEHGDLLAGVEGLNRYRAVSGMTGGEHAEAFFLAPLETYRALYRKLLP